MKNRITLLTLLATCLMLWSCDDTTKKKEGCGNGLLDLGEECDGSQLQNATCASLGHYNAVGVLHCSANCRYDLSDCGGRCGDGQVDIADGENCDGTNLNGNTCQSLGYSGGSLACGAGCTYDVSGCVGRCGNGVIDAEEGEVCDGAALAGETCQTQGYHGGALNCEADCGGYNLDNCTAVGRCGDGVIQATYGEVCEGFDLGGQTCESLGYTPRSGTLACLPGCAFDESSCVEKSANADLATLTLSAGMLTPAFSPATTSYTVTVTVAVTSLTVAGTAADAPWATVAVSPSQPMTLSLGPNPVTVTVTAEDGTQKTYTVTVTRQATLDYESVNLGTLIFVPAGTFQRDATATNLSTVSEFRMSQYEITRAQWTAVTGWADPSNVTYSGGTSDPVQQVSWYDAIAFCNKLSFAEGLTPVYSVSGVNFSTLTYAQIPTSSNTNWNQVTANWAANGYRLPTEMEWMWAAMGADLSNPGVTNTTGYAKAFAGSTGSNLIGDYVWYTTNSGSKTHPAGMKLPNELGLYDLSGNVWEWAWDWYAMYPSGTMTDYRGPASGTDRVFRGGSWSGAASGCAVAARSNYYPYSRYYDIGFRVVRP